MSLGGIAFSYVDTGKRLNTIFELDIFVDDSFSIKNVRVKIISDSEIGEIVGASKKIRRLGGQFLGLTPQQEDDLANFLRQYK